MEKRDYDVAEGVPWVNGQRVPETRVVTLTEAEARFDLSLGRITPKASNRRKAPPAVSGDEASNQ